MANLGYGKQVFAVPLFMSAYSQLATSLITRELRNLPLTPLYEKDRGNPRQVVKIAEIWYFCFCLRSDLKFFE